jgi:phosphinothricin acetyltransferase
MSDQPSFSIIDASADDLGSVQQIYAHYVENTTVCLDEYAPSVEAMRERFDLVQSYDLPYLVAKEGDTIVGYAYAVQYRPRSAYRFCVEQSVYLHPDHVGKGIGKALVEELLSRCEALGIRQVIAVITRTDHVASGRLHERFGFEEVGVLESIAYKFGEWIDTVMLQKSLGDGNNTDPVERSDLS